MPDTSETNPVDEFKQGILRHDHSLVVQALKKGVQPDTPVEGQHPLIALLRKTFDDLPQAERKQIAEVQFEQSTRDIVSRLLDSGAKVAEEGKHKTDFLLYLADRFLLNEDTETVANIVIHAIAETLKDGRPVYQPNIANFVANFLAAHADEKADYREVAGQIVNSIETVYDAVRQKLENPQTALEREVAENGKVLPWKSPLVRPELDDLLQKLGLESGGVKVRAPGLAPDAAEDFGESAPRILPFKEFLTDIEKQEPSAVLLDLKNKMVGHADLQTELKRMVFRQNFDASRKARDLPVNEGENHSTVFLGNEGVGKGIMARKKMELMVALGLAGPKNFSITEENIAEVAGATSPQTLARLFAQADTAIIELPSAPSAPGPNTPDLGRTFMLALQMSLNERKKMDKPPTVIFLTGRREDVEELFDQIPALKGLTPNVRPMADLTDPELGKVLERKLKKEGYELDADGAALVMEELDKARKRYGTNEFRFAKEIDAIVKNLPDAMAERLSQGAEENEGALIAPPPEADLTHATVADIRALNIPRIVGGFAQTRRNRMGF